jgi:hypothetical protein
VTTEAAPPASAVPPSGDLRWRWVTIAIFVATVAQLLVATFFASELSRFEGKGFGARLIAY